MPNFDTELLVVVLAELSTVILALHEDVAFHLVGQMQCCSARSELLEDNQVDAVGIYLEGNWQVLPAQVAAESIDQVCQWAEYHHGQLVGLDVGPPKACSS